VTQVPDHYVLFIWPGQQPVDQREDNVAECSYLKGRFCDLKFVEV